MEKKLFIFDLETYPNFFLAVFKCIITGKYSYFEISDRKTDQNKLKNFLNQEVKGLIGFNNLNFDYPVLHNTILKSNKLLTSQEIYKEVEVIINTKYSAIWDNQIKIPQLDLYKINHYDNMARSTSLKWLEFAMRLENVEDLPYKPGTILTSEQMDEIISYCKNDIEATEKFYHLNLDNIEFRKNMCKELQHNVMNYSDVKIGEYINQITYEKISGRKYEEFKNLRTKRDLFYVKDLIPDYVSFKTDYLKNFLIEISDKTFNLNESKDKSFHRILHFANIIIKFAKGGVHSEDKPLILTKNIDEIIQEKDVGSMYPGSIIEGKFYPEHLGEEWYLGIKHLFDERNFNIKPALKKEVYKSHEYNFLDSKQNAYKLGMNGGGYGKTGSDFSWQYDPMVIMKTTFKGQLSLLMLVEDLYLAGVQIISMNTDGVVIKYNKSLSEIVLKIHTNWEKTTRYILEDTNYEKIIFRDVNNYIAYIIDDKGNHLKYKMKGCFEIDRDYHKNHSKRIVPIALANYFINNVSVENTIYNHLNKNKYSFCENYGIYDFCLGAKMKGQNELVQRYWKGYDLIEEPLSKMNRYYVSNTGVELIKKLPPLEKHYLTETDKYKLKFDPNQMNIFDIIEDVKIDAENRDENLESGYKCTLFNKYKEYEYDLNYDYYIKECYNIIDKLN